MVTCYVVQFIGEDGSELFYKGKGESSASVMDARFFRTPRGARQAQRTVLRYHWKPTVAKVIEVTIKIVGEQEERP